MQRRKQEKVHFQRMALFPVQSAPDAVPKELMLQSEYFSSGEQLVKRIEDVRISNGEYEALVK